MNFDLILLKGLYLFSTFIACAFFLQRLLGRRRKRLGRRLGFYPSGASMGNALHRLQVIAQPQVQYVLEEKLDEEAEDEDAGGPDDPNAHFHRQAARIRRGEKIDRLTLLHRMKTEPPASLEAPKQRSD